MFINWLKQSSILLIIISQLFLTSLSVEGETHSGSTSPVEPRPQRRSSGTRGECVQEHDLVTLVVPETNQNREVEQSQQGTDDGAYKPRGRGANRIRPLENPAPNRIRGTAPRNAVARKPLNSIQGNGRPQFKANIPQTTLPRPTFVWHMAQKSNLPIKFTLSEPGKTIYVEELNLSKAGFVTLTLPETVPPLEVGKHYRWTVSILCNRQHPSQNPFAQAWIERIASSNSYLKEKNLSCDTYEKEEIWYDLLACYFQRRSRADLSQLLSRINLSSLIFSK